MGEPFRPNSRDDDALADWFQQADQDHDGRLTMVEMEADSGRFFLTLDVNHDGEIDPDEIKHYEDVIAPEIQIGAHLALDGSNGNDQRSRHRHNRRADLDTNDRGAALFGLFDLPEPVISADADFDRGVSLFEFRRAAGNRFIALDLAHHGFLTLSDLELTRPAPPPRPTKEDNGEGADGLTPTD